MAKLPLPPADLASAIGIRNDECRELTVDTLLWRVHRVRGKHITPWNRSRHFGPVDARFEPHPAGPATTYPDRGVWYAALAPQTAVAEGDPALTSRLAGICDRIGYRIVV